jgi:hypothetical protein
MITMLQETTDWGDAPVANGIYHVNDAGELVGYKGPKSEYKKFKKPQKRFSKSGRKFEVVGTYEDEEVSDAKTWKFEGSKGNIYVVTDEDGIIKCTCPGFKFRGQCKHSGEIIANGAGGQAPAWQ